ncbi:aldolase/citrate lyase family protein [Mesorhizobium sp. M1066]|jgi:2-keto-3-deoxy-L-rhamnonate aldolase RhmA|uniref:HpcH/HpaI aldolase family protein n=1 Tax=unclassified Mesorhizobium TaxID=325217 RepID=UPI00333855DA
MIGKQRMLGTLSLYPSRIPAEHRRTLGIPMTIHNRAKQKLLAGQLSLGIGLRQARTVDIARIARSCDYDWLFIDMEHNSMDQDTAAQICVAALDVGITPLVRVPGHEHFHASRLLDTGALGIVAPHVNNRAEAERLVSNCLFPPAGKRSIPGGMPQVQFQPVPITELVTLINTGTLIVAMIETPEGLENVDAIAALEGIDVLLMGGNDMAAELGIHGQFTHPRMRQAFATIATACHRHGKFPGVGGIYDHDIMAEYIAAGARFILSGSDLSFMMTGAKARSSYLRSLQHAGGEEVLP